MRRVFLKLSLFLFLPHIACASIKGRRRGGGDKMEFDENRLKELLKKGKYVWYKVGVQTRVGETRVTKKERDDKWRLVRDGVYKLWKDEAAFIKDFLGLDKNGYAGFIEVKEAEIVAYQDFDWDCMDRGVFAVKVSNIPKDKRDRKEIAKKYGFYFSKIESEIKIPWDYTFGPWEDEEEDGTQQEGTSRIVRVCSVCLTGD